MTLVTPKVQTNEFNFRNDSIIDIHVTLYDKNKNQMA